MNIAILAGDAAESAQLEASLHANALAVRVHLTLPDLLANLDEYGCDVLIASVAALGSMPHSALDSARALLAPGTPVLLLGDAAQEDELVAALEAGADDYVLKPLRRAELTARLRILLKRARRDHPALASEQIDGVAFDAGQLRVTIQDQSVDLKRKEFELALLLFRHLGRPLSRTYLLESLWSDESDQISRSLDTHISRVRSKLGLRPDNGYRLSPVYGYGYVLERLSPGAGSDGVQG